MLLVFLGCADTWIERPYACEHATLDWWEPDPAWLVARATEGDDGAWQFDAPSGYAATDRTEGYWEPSTGRFGFTRFSVEASSHARVDVNGAGTIAPSGDLDLVTEVLSYDDLGLYGAWTETTTRRGCVTERAAVNEGDTIENVSTATFVDDDTVAGTFTYAPAGYDATYAETSTTTRDLTQVSAGGWSDGSYMEERESRANGETDVRWEDHSDDERGRVAFGDEHFGLDGSRESTTREEVDGVVVRTCTLALSYAGEGSATCYEPDTDVTCTYVYGPEACNYECDDGDGGGC